MSNPPQESLTIDRKTCRNTQFFSPSLNRIKNFREIWFLSETADLRRQRSLCRTITTAVSSEHDLRLSVERFYFFVLIFKCRPIYTSYRAINRSSRDRGQNITLFCFRLRRSRSDIDRSRRAPVHRFVRVTQKQWLSDCFRAVNERWETNVPTVKSLHNPDCFECFRNY